MHGAVQSAPAGGAGRCPAAQGGGNTRIPRGAGGRNNESGGGRFGSARDNGSAAGGRAFGQHDHHGGLYRSFARFRGLNIGQEQENQTIRVSDSTSQRSAHAENYPQDLRTARGWAIRVGRAAEIFFKYVRAGHIPPAP